MPCRCRCREIPWGGSPILMARVREDMPLPAPSWLGLHAWTPSRVVVWMMAPQISATAARQGRHSRPTRLSPTNHETLIHAP